jgi:hypothetical protein
MIATAVVHTTGINWESIAAIGGLVVAIVGGFGRWLRSSMQKQRQEDRESTLAQTKLITDSSLAQVKLLTDAMSTRMGIIDNHLTAQDVVQVQQGKDLARMEGRMISDKPKPKEKV